MKKILITGGNGFVGRNLIKELQKNHPKVKIVVVDNYSTSEVKDRIKGVKFYKLHTKNIQRLGQQNFDTVFHFGEYSRIATSFEDIETIIESNVYGTAKVIEYCRKYGCKLIYSASSSKFGNTGDDEHLSPYAWSKAKNVELIKNYNKWYDLQYEICYFYNVYGPGQISSGRFATVIGIWEEQYKSGAPISVVSPGTQKRCFTHISDVINGLLKSVSMNLNHEWYLKHRRSFTLNDIALTFKDDIEFLPSVRGDRKTAPNIYNDTEDKLMWIAYYDIIQYIRNFKSSLL